jgi:hypothetical protein
MVVKMTFFWVVMPCGLVGRYQCFSKMLVSMHETTQAQDHARTFTYFKVMCHFHRGTS